MNFKSRNRFITIFLSLYILFIFFLFFKSEQIGISEEQNKFESSKSYDLNEQFMKTIHIDTNFIVTGATRFDTTDYKEKKQLAELFAKKYDVTIHIYGEALLYVKRSAKKSLQYELHKDSWPGDAIEILDEIHKKEIAAI